MLQDDLDQVEYGASLVTGQVAALGDAELQALWEQAYVIEGGEWNLYFDPFYTFMEKHDARINSKANAIRDKLAE